MKKLFKIIAPLAMVGALVSCNSNIFQLTTNVDDSTEVTKVTTSISEVVEKVEKSCVGIVGYDDSTEVYGIGSGVVVAQDGSDYTIITNSHVIISSESTEKNGINTPYKNIKVCVGNQYTQYKADVVKYDSDKDLAMLKVSVAKSDTIQALDLKSSTPTVTVGETCIAIGCPLSLTYYNTVTTGVISKPEYSIATSKGSELVLQHDAAINPGNSGGGLFNMAGQLIGINFEKRTQTTSNGTNILVEGVGFAISINEVLEFIK